MKNLSPDNGHLLQIARQLLKRDYFSPLDKLLDGSFDELNLSYLKLKALSAYRQHNYLVAIEWFKQALAFDPDNAVMIRKMAETAFLIPDYSQAEKLYAVYIGLSGAKDDLCEDEYNFSLCCLQTKDTDKAMNTLYKLYYLHEDNVKYKQALVWGLIQNGKADEALKIVSSISDDELDGESSVRKALLLWMSHDKSQAVASMRTFARKKTVSPQKLSAMLLQQNECCNMKMNEVDLYVICDLVYDE